MSVLYPEHVDTWWIDAPEPWRCIECGETVGPPLVYWQGAFTLMAHAECAEIMGIALLKDSRECELAKAPDPHWRRRAVAVVRHRLQTEERVALLSVRWEPLGS